MLVCEASGETLLSEVFVKMASSDVTVLRWSNSWSVISCEMWDRKINVKKSCLRVVNFFEERMSRCIQQEPEKWKNRRYVIAPRPACNRVFTTVRLWVWVIDWVALRICWVCIGGINGEFKVDLFDVLREIKDH